MVCNTSPVSYREGSLANNRLPATALPGFGMEGAPSTPSSVVVSVGFAAVDLGQIVRSASAQNISFLMPFPPASPSFRRSWKVLHSLTEDFEIAEPKIVRISGNDLFQVLNWLAGNQIEGQSMTMLPFGPKSHSAAMALTQLRNPKQTELVYPQPQRYHPRYSAGIQLDHSGIPTIHAYGLRRDGVSVV